MKRGGGGGVWLTPLTSLAEPVVAIVTAQMGSLLWLLLPHLHLIIFFMNYTGIVYRKLWPCNTRIPVYEPQRQAVISRMLSVGKFVEIALGFDSQLCSKDEMRDACEISERRDHKKHPARCFETSPKSGRGASCHLVYGDPKNSTGMHYMFNRFTGIFRKQMIFVLLRMIITINVFLCISIE